MMHVPKLLLCMTFSIALYQTASCMDNHIDMTPAARAGNEIISRAFLSYTADKLGIKNASMEKKKELLNKIIENIAISNNARSIGLHMNNNFREERDHIIFQTRMEYLCSTYRFNDDCAKRLFQKLCSVIELRKPEIEWNKVFLKKEAPLIPYGGKIPAISTKKTSNREEVINMPFAKSTQIISRKEHLTLAELLLSIKDEEFMKISDSNNDEQTDFLQQLLLQRYIVELTNELREDYKALLKEIEHRAEQNFLVELYRKHIGFEQISGGKSSRVRYSVSENEIREFYEKNVHLFEEPEWVEISHIRLRDFDKAVQLKKKIDDDLHSFCDIARKHSIAKDASRCGYIGLVKRAKNLPLYKEFAFTMNRVGEISRPFLANGFVEIVKLHKKKTRILPLNNPHVRKLVTDAIQPIKREEKLRKTIDEEKRKLTIEIYN